MNMIIKDDLTQTQRLVLLAQAVTATRSMTC